MEHKCTQCGICCSSKIFDVIFVTGREVNLIESKISGCKCFKGYGFGSFEEGGEVETIFTIKFVHGRCPFQKDNKCSIHDIRPRTCRDYPRKTHWFLCVNESNKKPKEVLHKQLQKASPEQFLKLVEENG